MITKSLRGNDEHRRDSYELERFIRDRRLIPSLELLLRRHGTRAVVHRNLNSTQSEALPPDSSQAREAYGQYSGFATATPIPSDKDPRKIFTPADPNISPTAWEGLFLIPNYVFASSDQTYANDFEEYFIWSFEDLHQDDIIDTSKFNTNRRVRLKAISIETWGNSTKVASRVKVAHVSF